jgi:hypothetical protein
LKKLIRVLLLLWELLIPTLTLIHLRTNILPLPKIEAASALEWWTVLSIGQLLIGMVFAYFHLRRISRDTNWYASQFKFAQTRTEDLSYKDAEQSRSIFVLVMSIYGIGVVIGATLMYFMIASRFNFSEGGNDPYIFVNNEGFIVAITLLIIILSGAVVTIYVEVAKSLRGAIDSFEVEVSRIAQVVSQIGNHADQVWSHFEVISRNVISDFFHGLEPNSFSSAEQRELYTPLVLITDVNPSKFFNTPDEALLYDAPEEPTERITETERPDLYPAIEDLEHSKTRFLQAFNLNCERESRSLNEYEQRLRARRLRYLGWALKRQVDNDQPQPEQDSRPFKFPNSFVPATERSLFELLRAHGDFTDEDNILARARKGFHARVYRAHLSDISGEPGSKGLEFELKGLCGPLDLDYSVFIDDVIVFGHLAGLANITGSQNLIRAADARLLYFSLWLQGGTHPKSAISDLLFLLANPDAEVPSHAGVNGKTVLRDIWNRLRDMSIDSDGDLFHDSNYILQEIQKMVHTQISTNALKEHAILPFSCRLLNNQQEFISLGEKPRKFIRWLVEEVIKDSEYPDHNYPQERAPTHESTNQNGDSLLLIRALWRVSPTFRARYAKRKLNPGSERAELRSVIKKIYEYCANRANRDVMIAYFFASDADYHRWLMTFSETTLDRRLERFVEMERKREFLLLSLGDRRSALSFWLRAIRSCDMRTNLMAYEDKLDKLQGKLPTHFGLEILPSHNLRMDHLRIQLGAADESQRPISMRSIYDFEPRGGGNLAPPFTVDTVEDETGDYAAVCKFLSISHTWESSVRITPTVREFLRTYFVSRQSILQRPVDFPNNFGNNSSDANKIEKFLTWLVSDVFPERDYPDQNYPQERAPTEESTNLTGHSLLLIQALWRVSPTFRDRIENRAERITDEEAKRQFAKIVDRITNYCDYYQNAERLQEIFFGRDHNITRLKAPGLYEKWLVGFRARTNVTRLLG